jgi:predicted O-methyltransferase YrrM
MLSKGRTLSRGLRFVLTHPTATLRWAAFCLEDDTRREAAKMADKSQWFQRIEPHRTRFELFLEEYRLEAPNAVRLVNTTLQEGSVAEYELFMLSTLCRCVRARAVMEIGTYRGRTTCNLAANIAEKGRVYTLNYSDASLANIVVGEMYRGTPLEGLIETIMADSMHFDFSPWYGQVDLMFIDGNHSLSYVQKDSENAFRCVRPGGIIAWHDVDPKHPETTVAALGACEQHGATPRWIDGTQTLLAIRPTSSAVPHARPIA